MYAVSDMIGYTAIAFGWGLLVGFIVSGLMRDDF